MREEELDGALRGMSEEQKATKQLSINLLLPALLLLLLL